MGGSSLDRYHNVDPPPKKKDFPQKKIEQNITGKMTFCILKYVYTRNIVAEFYTWKIKRGKVLY